MSAKGVRVLAVAGAVSLCFNLFFLSGYLHARGRVREMTSEEGRMRLVAARLGLSKDQREKIGALRAELRAKIDAFKKENKEELDAFWAEMGKDRPDAERIRAMIQESAEEREDLRLTVVEYLEKVFPLLTPQQRIAFSRMIRERDFGRQW